MSMGYTVGLRVHYPDGKSEEAVFDAASVLVGSGPSAVLRLTHPTVSTIHCVIKADRDDGVRIIDLGSEAGTRVNQAPVTESSALHVGDHILVGGVSIDVMSIARSRRAPKAHTLASEEKTIEAGVEHRPNGAKTVSNTNASTPSSGQHIIRDNDRIDERFLKTPLDERQRPTDNERVLEVAVFWGDECIDSVQVAEPRAVTVAGQGQSGDLHAELPWSDGAVTVAVNEGARATIVFPSDADVAVRRGSGEVTRSVEAAPTDAPFAAKSCELALGDRVVFKAGTLTFVAQYVRGHAELGAGAATDWFFPRVFALSAMAHLFFVAAAFITPRYASNLGDDLMKNQGQFAEFILKAQEREKPTKRLDLSGMKGGAKPKGDEGKFGKKNRPQKDALASKAGAPRVDAEKREKDRKIAMNSGLLGILKGAGGAGAVSNVFGPGGLGTGINNSMGGLRGSSMGDAGGAGGLGTRGTGAGGGGTALGIGGLGTHGHGRGTGGAGNIDLGGRGKGRTRIIPGRTIVQGSLKKEEIARVIRRNLARFKYCYEKQLNKNPNLSGKIAVKFTIAPTGSVAKASISESSMNDGTVEGCVSGVMKTLKFPRPRGGGLVVVTYPFVFAPT